MNRYAPASRSSASAAPAPFASAPVPGFAYSVPKVSEPGESLALFVASVVLAGATVAASWYATLPWHPLYAAAAAHLVVAGVATAKRGRWRRERNRLASYGARSTAVVFAAHEQAALGSTMLRLTAWSSVAMAVGAIVGDYVLH